MLRLPKIGFLGVGVVWLACAAIVPTTQAWSQVTVKEATTLNCDGTFKTTLNYESKTRAQHQGSFGNIAAFSKIEADKMDPFIPGVVTISGELRNACAAGATTFVLSGSITTNVNVRASPLQGVVLPSKPVHTDEMRAFTYQVTLTPCPATAGAAVALTTTTSASIVGVSVRPSSFNLRAAGQVLTVTGKLKPEQLSGFVRISLTKPAADHCVFPDTEISE
jgi:hypothetical protein